MVRRNVRYFSTSQKWQIVPRQTVMALLSNWSIVSSIWVIALRRDETLILPLPAGCNGSIRQALLTLSLRREMNPLPVVQTYRARLGDICGQTHPFLHTARCSTLHRISQVR